MVDLDVYSKNKQKSRQPEADWLPSTPFLMGASGPSMSGKGVLIQNLIMNPSLYHDEKGESVFDEVHYWSGSAKLDINLDKLKNGSRMCCIKIQTRILQYTTDSNKTKCEML